METIQYRTPLSARLLDGMIAAALGLTLALFSSLFPLAFALLAIDEWELNPWVAWAIVIPAVLAGWIYAWSVFAYRVRASVTFFPEYVQIGEGWTMLAAGYQEIEEVQFPEEQEGNWLKLRIGGRSVRVVLRERALRESLQLLMERCNNAIIVDSEGREFASVQADFDFTLLVLQRRKRRIAIGCLLAAIAFAILFLGRVWVVMAWWNEEIELDGFDLILLWPGVILMLLAACATASAAWFNYRRASDLQRLRLRISDS